VNAARVIAPRYIILSLPCRAQKQHNPINVKCWETIAEKLSASGLSWGCSSEFDVTGRVLYTADAYRKDGKRFTVIADDRLTAFLELERVTHDDLNH
jgi:hypothetical protein